MPSGAGTRRAVNHCHHTPHTTHGAVLVARLSSRLGGGLSPPSTLCRDDNALRATMPCELVDASCGARGIEGAQYRGGWPIAGVAYASSCLLQLCG